MASRATDWPRLRPGSVRRDRADQRPDRHRPHPLDHRLRPLRRARRSASITASTESAIAPSCRDRTASKTSGMDDQPILPSRNASTATSLAALSQAGAVPPARPAS